ncbi:MAG TPA: DHA2 family efflux MFS transporter permease subunit, partial [bacterium]
TPPTGWLSGYFGRKRLFLITITVFTATSILCGLAQNLEQIVVYRLLQGLSGAAFVPLSQATLLDNYPKEKHGMAMALFGIGLMVGPILGPSLGGWLTETYNWRWVFFINVPIGIMAFVLVTIFLVETDKTERRFDAFGFGLISLAVGAMQMMLDRGQQLDWFSSLEIIIETALAVVAFYMFIAHSFTHKQPFIDLNIFRDSNFAAGCVFMGLIASILLASMALYPPFMQDLLGYPVLTTGLVLAPRGAGTMLGMMVVGRLGHRVDPRKMMLLGLTLLAISLWMMSSFNLEVDIQRVFWVGMVQGLGFGFVFVPLTTVTFATLDPARRTDGTGLFNLMRNVGGSIGISAMVTLLARNVQVNHANLSEHISPYRDGVPALERFLRDPSATKLAMIDLEVNRQSAMISYLNDFRLMMWICIAAMPLVLIMRNPYRSAAPTAAPAEALGE